MENLSLETLSAGETAGPSATLAALRSGRDDMTDDQRTDDRRLITED